MGSFLRNFTFYIFGAAVGSLVTLKAVKKYYSDIADEEIKSVKEHRSNPKLDIMINEISSAFKNYNEKEETDFSGDASIMSYRSKRKKSNYHKMFDKDESIYDNGLYPDDERPGIEKIDEEHFNSDPQYEKITVYYYAELDTITDEHDNENLTDDSGKIIDSYNSLLHVDVYTSDGDGPIYLRSNGLGIDFEVIKV